MSNQKRKFNTQFYSNNLWQDYTYHTDYKEAEQSFAVAVNVFPRYNWRILEHDVTPTVVKFTRSKDNPSYQTDIKNTNSTKYVVESRKLSERQWVFQTEFDSHEQAQQQINKLRETNTSDTYRIRREESVVTYFEQTTPDISKTAHRNKLIGILRTADLFMREFEEHTDSKPFQIYDINEFTNTFTLKRKNQSLSFSFECVKISENCLRAWSLGEYYVFSAFTKMSLD